VRVSAASAAEAAGLNYGDLNNAELPVMGVSIVQMPRLMQRLLGRQVHAVTLGKTIFVEESRFGSIVGGGSNELLAHELIHVGQWDRDGRPGFLASYLGDYLRLRLLGLDHTNAYRNIGYEYEAYAGAARIVDRS
jgi:hypothetical protein